MISKTGKLNGNWTGQDVTRAEMNQFPSINEQMDLIRRGVSDLIPEEELVKKLERSKATGKPIVVKLGCDPSRPDLHIGHAVILRKMRQFQDLGHHAILIIGDFTGMIGDPTGKSKTRPPLTLEETRINGRTYTEQAVKILDPAKLEILHNSDWLGKLTFEEVVKLSAKFTVSQMMERDDFHKRFNQEIPISLHEFLYPLAQAQDSVVIKADVELGGTDQKFNLLMGRELQRANGQEPQCILTMPILEGTDGVEKMSKSLNNYIGITEDPFDMYGKTLSIPDSSIYNWFVLCTNFPTGQLAGLKDQISSDPRNTKRLLAREIVKVYYSEAEARKAEEKFDTMFIKKDVPDDIPEVTLTYSGGEYSLTQFLADQGFVPSKGEGKRLIQGGGVSVNGEKITDPNYLLKEGGEKIVKAGKRNFVKILK